MSVDLKEHRSAYRVVTHDSWRGDGRPVAVFSGGARFDVMQIERSWVAAGVDTASPVRRGFEVRCKGGARFTLVHTDDQGWSVEPHPGPRLVT